MEPEEDNLRPGEPVPIGDQDFGIKIRIELNGLIAEYRNRFYSQDGFESSASVEQINKFFNKFIEAYNSTKGK